MAAGKVRHWKHGWIPVSPEAKAYLKGKGPKPVSDTSPNARAHGLPTRSVKGDKGGGERRARAISELVPSIGIVEPFYRGESQDMNGHFTGGVRTSRLQTDALVNHVEKYGPKTEGESKADRDMAASGQPIRQVTKAANKEQAEHYADRLAAVIPGLRSGSKAGKPLPYYAPKPLPNGSYYDGGLTFSPAQADVLIDWLGDSVHGGDDRRKV